MTRVKIPTDRDTGRPRGFAFIEMADATAAASAIAALNGRDVGGRQLRVNRARSSKGERSGGRRWRRRWLRTLVAVAGGGFSERGGSGGGEAGGGGRRPRAVPAAAVVVPATIVVDLWLGSLASLVGKNPGGLDGNSIENVG